MIFTFQNPSYLFLLFIIPGVIFFHFYSLTNLKGKAVKFANFDAIARVKGIDIYSKNIIVLILNILIVISLVLSISGLTLHKEMTGTYFSYAIAIDSSESMGATDIKPDRLSFSKISAKSFIDSLPSGTKVAVISFAGNSIIEQELTSNKELLKTAIDKIEITKIGGTDLFEAISISSRLLKSQSNDAKAMILISDGQINIGNIDEVIDMALFNDIVVHTIGIGTVQGGNASFGISKIDEDSLKSIAYSTKGKYFNARSEENLKKAFLDIIPLTNKLGAIDLSLYLIIVTIILFILQQIASSYTKVSI